MYDVIHHLTLKKLKDHDACDKAQEWFEKNYPIGVYLTENDMQILIEKLLARKYSFFTSGSLTCETNLCTQLCMMWLLESIFGVQGIYTNDLSYLASAKKVLKTFYKDLDHNIKATKKG